MKYEKNGSQRYNGIVSEVFFTQYGVKKGKIKYENGKIATFFNSNGTIKNILNADELKQGDKVSFVVRKDKYNNTVANDITLFVNDEDRADNKKKDNVLTFDQFTKELQETQKVNGETKKEHIIKNKHTNVKAAGVKSVFAVDDGKVLITSFNHGNSAVVEYTGNFEDDLKPQTPTLTLKENNNKINVKKEIIKETKEEPKKEIKVVLQGLADNPTKVSNIAIGETQIGFKSILENHFFGRTFNDNIHIQIIHNILDIKKILAVHTNNIVYALDNIHESGNENSNGQSTDMIGAGGISTSKCFGVYCAEKSNPKKNFLKQILKNEKISYFGEAFYKNGKKRSDVEVYHILAMLNEVRNVSTHFTEDDNRDWAKANLYNLENRLCREAKGTLNKLYQEKIDKVNLENFIQNGMKNDFRILFNVLKADTDERKVGIVKDLYEFSIKKTYKNTGFSIKRIRELLFEEADLAMYSNKSEDKDSKAKYDTVRSKAYKLIDFIIWDFCNKDENSEIREDLLNELRSYKIKSDEDLTAVKDKIYKDKFVDVVKDKIKPYVNEVFSQLEKMNNFDVEILTAVYPGEDIVEKYTTFKDEFYSDEYKKIYQGISEQFYPGEWEIENSSKAKQLTDFIIWYYYDGKRTDFNTIAEGTTNRVRVLSIVNKMKSSKSWFKVIQYELKIKGHINLPENYNDIENIGLSAKFNSDDEKKQAQYLYTHFNKNGSNWDGFDTFEVLYESERDKISSCVTQKLESLYKELKDKERENIKGLNLAKFNVNADDIQNNSELYKTVAESYKENINATLLVQAEEVSCFSKLVYLVTLFLDGKEINDLLTTLINKFDNIASLLAVLEKAPKEKDPNIDGVLNNDNNTTKINERVHFSEAYSFFNSENILGEKLAENSKDYNCKIVNELREINSVARMSGKVKVENVAEKDARALLGWAEETLTKPEEQFLKNNVINSKWFNYVVRYTRPEIIKKAAKNEKIVLFVLNRLPEEQVNRYYTSYITSLENSGTQNTEVCESIENKILFLAYKVCQIANAESKLEQDKVITTLYLTILYQIAKNLVYVNSRYVMAFHSLERDARIEYYQTKKVEQVEETEKSEEDEFEISDDYCVLAKKSVAENGNRRMPIDISDREAEIKGKAEAGFEEYRKICTGKGETPLSKDEFVDDCWKKYYKKKFEEKERKHNYIKQNIENADNQLIRQFRNNVAHLNTIRNMEGIENVTGITSYFQIYHYLMQKTLKQWFEKCSEINYVNEQKALKEQQNQRYQPFIFKDGDDYRFAYSKFDKEKKEREDFVDEMNSKTIKYITGNYEKTYCKDFVKALCAPFAYNLPRFKNLSIEELFDMHELSKEPEESMKVAD